MQCIFGTLTEHPRRFEQPQIPVHVPNAFVMDFALPQTAWGGLGEAAVMEQAEAAAVALVTYLQSQKITFEVLPRARAKHVAQCSRRFVIWPHLRHHCCR